MAENKKRLPEKLISDSLFTKLLSEETFSFHPWKEKAKSSFLFETKKAWLPGGWSSTDCRVGLKGPPRNDRYKQIPCFRG